MDAKPLTSEAIALTEKKMGMALDAIIEMNKKTSTKAKMQPRVPNKSQKFSNGLAQDKTAKSHRFMDSRSSLRQGLLAKRRSNFQGNQFPVAVEVARKAAIGPLRNRAFNSSRVANWNKTRVGVPLGQRRTANRGFASKPLSLPQQQQYHEVSVVPKQRPQTLDSLFANMKEQRMRVLSRQNNSVPHIGGQRRPPWRRGRFGY
ncbi:Ribosome maturation factor [Quillaja saponaria]|uniref:Ribosome maturation factor n=1 Tax=Quillaja saponaria TaxID=32244 RepID=A0AAD7KSL0_QUISA|nr:Ribosome maturation factor [Quillaja saponaria]